MNYFTDKDLQLLFATLKEKYIKTSKLTGTIKITPSYNEANKIGRFLGMNLKAEKENIIKIKNIELAIKKSKFEGLMLLDILTYLYGEISTKKEVRDRQEAKKELLLEELTESYQSTEIASWLRTSLEEKEFYQRIIYLLNHDKESLYNILNALIKMPTKKNEFVNISIFSSLITRDPHYFDLDSTHNHDLVWMLCKYFKKPFSNTREFKIKILNDAGIYIDNISNFVITYNLHGSKYLDDLAKRNEVAILSLNNLYNLSKIYALNRKIIILENPSLLNVLINKNYNSAFIITSGNPNSACYQLLNKLKEHKLYYNGDFDPEGLLIAEKLCKEYSNLTLFGYDLPLYLKAQANKKITSSRLKKMSKITTNELMTVKKAIIKTGQVGYQEKIIEDLIDIIVDIENEYSNITFI